MRKIKELPLAVVALLLPCLLIEHIKAFTPTLLSHQSNHKQGQQQYTETGKLIPYHVQSHTLSRLCATNKDSDITRKNDDNDDDNEETKGDENKSNAQSKEDLLKAIGEQMRSVKRDSTGGGSALSDINNDNNGGIFDKLNPFKAGQNLRKTLDTAFSSISVRGPSTSSGLLEDQKSMYYLDDRMLEFSSDYSETSFASTLQERLDRDDYVPEVLVVGAAGEVGRLVVRRLQLQKRFRVRVLVRDLYTKTLNMLGTGVTYCQGDLSNIDSLEYALTDVDKIVFCASAPRPDEPQFQSKFREYTQETLVQASGTRALTTTTTTTNSSATNVESDNDKIVSSKNGIGKVDRSISAEAAAAFLPQKTASDAEWEQLESVLAVRAQLAEQVDCIGMQNLIRAYQHVRHADYGTSQAAKRSLFKFSQGRTRKDDFNLFAVADDEDDDTGKDVVITGSSNDDDDKSDDSLIEAEDEDDDMYSASNDKHANYDKYNDDYEDDYSDYEDKYNTGSSSGDSAPRSDITVKSQVQWIRNKFDHAVFVGRLPKPRSGRAGGQTSIISTRFRSRERPDYGIDLSLGFAGFICRVCSDGGTYEAFVRTHEYYEHGYEYVCQFTTSTKSMVGRNKSSNKFVTVRLPFENFKPVKRKTTSSNKNIETVPLFKGQDVRNIGFRYRTSSNELKSKLSPGTLTNFYLAISYIKLYRSQPEPEFVYLSDARIPPVVRSSMVRHDARQLILPKDGGSSIGDDENLGLKILDEEALQTVTNDKMGRSPEETYYKYRGEEILKKSGLSYAIVRVMGFNESPSGEASSIELLSNIDSKTELTAISRDEAAQVCVSALLDPNALNKSFYLSKKSTSTTKGRKISSRDEDMAAKFSQLTADVVS